MSVIPIDFRLRAEVNGQTFTMCGTGAGNSAEGTCTLNLKAEPHFPKGFDPVSCPSICSHPTSSFFSRPQVEGSDLASTSGYSYAVRPSRRGLVFDSQGRQVLDLEVSSQVWFQDGRLISEHQMTGTSDLPRLVENLTPFDDYLLPSGPDQATALVRFKLLSEAGEVLDGMTFAPYCWRSGRALPSPLARRVEEIEVHWDGGREVSAYYRTSVRPLVSSQEADFHLMLPSGLGDPSQLIEMAKLSRS